MTHDWIEVLKDRRMTPKDVEEWRSSLKAAYRKMIEDADASGNKEAIEMAAQIVNTEIDKLIDLAIEGARNPYMTDEETGLMSTARRLKSESGED